MLIRDASAQDWPQLWAFMQGIVAAGDTYTYDPTTTGSELQELWLEGTAFVAVEGSDILGTAKAGPNRAGPGSHVGTASFMVDAAHRGHGVGRCLVEHVLGWCSAQGFEAIQFNAVAASNVHAVQLYGSVGFSVVGRVPHAFRHPPLGDVDLLVMHREL